ncbi:hypothetical protein RhiirA4_245862 [Rhizophagus irregularis]|uniref:Uncharacterized protein n=1 Tax=Rhizophagus irregularis TaxID=588596 RepID=A0A2I1GSB0_9GLOM|nr:hypothetical protein RhiirA4_245862 [Rhizophagus irregularis]
MYFGEKTKTTVPVSYFYQGDFKSLILDVLEKFKIYFTAVPLFRQGYFKIKIFNIWPNEWAIRFTIPDLRIKVLNLMSGILYIMVPLLWQLYLI